MPLLQHEPRAPRKHAVLSGVMALRPDLQARGVTHAALFGSVLRDCAQANSDIDLLIDVSPSRRFSLLDFAGVKLLLEDRLERPVDLVLRAGIDPLLKATVLAEAERIF